MITTFKVRFWEIADWAKSKDKKKKKGRPYGVRWVTDGKSHSEWYSTKALANNRRSELMQAAREGEPFDVESGLPTTELKRRNSLSFVEFAQSYLDMKWPDAAAKTRTSTVDALATAGTGFVRDATGRPEAADIRRMLTSALLPPVNDLSIVRRQFLVTRCRWQQRGRQRPPNIGRLWSPSSVTNKPGARCG